MKNSSQINLIKLIIDYAEDNFVDGGIVVQLQNYKKLISYLESIGINHEFLTIMDTDVIVNGSPKLKKMLYEFSVSDRINTLLSSDFLVSLLDYYKPDFISNKDNQTANSMFYYIESNNYDKDCVSMYINELNNKTLTEEEERRLLERYHLENDLEAKKELIECHLKLVVNIAKFFKNRGVEFADLIQEGNLGLIKAIERFDLSKTNRLSTYAEYWIKQSIRCHIRSNCNTIRIPVHLLEDANRVKAFSNKYKLLNGVFPSNEEISNSLHLPISKVKECLELPNMVSFNSTIKNDKDSTEIELIDVFPSMNYTQEKFIDDMFIKEFSDAFDNAKLRENERCVLLYKFGFIDGKTHTFEQTAKYLYKIGLSSRVLHRERIRQIHNNAILKLRRDKVIKDFRPEATYTYRLN